MLTTCFRIGKILFLGAPLLFGTYLCAADPDVSVVARAVSVNGVVTANKRVLSPGDKLTAGETIETGLGANIKIILYDRSIIDIGPSSSFRVQKVEETEGTPTIETELDWGSVRSSIQKKIGKRSRFNMHTKTSVLAVRGTEFVVNLDRSSTGLTEKVTVSDGLVNVTSNVGGKEVSLDAGKQFVQEAVLDKQHWVSRGNATVTEVPLKVVKEVIAHATVVDHTFNQAVEVSATGNTRSSFSGSATVAALGAAFTEVPSPRPAPTAAAQDPTRTDNPTALAITPLQQTTPDISGGHTVNVTAIFK